MSSISAETARERLALWLEAEAAVATGQSYTIGTRTLTRANLNAIRAEIVFWDNKVAETEAAATRRGRSRVFQVIPRDL
jgi:antitoxin (DNA-binding transcriptional repressor) of toxin-antitoxin stability system